MITEFTLKLGKDYYLLNLRAEHEMDRQEIKSIFDMYRKKKGKVPIEGDNQQTETISIRLPKEGAFATLDHLDPELTASILGVKFPRPRTDRSKR